VPPTRLEKAAATVTTPSATFRPREGKGRGAGPSITSAPFLGSKTEPWHEQTRPMTTQQLRGAIVSRLADLFRILRERQRQPELGSNQAENPLAIEQSNEGQATSS